jgi:heme-degrading monooxygenase HmoA
MAIKIIIRRQVPQSKYDELSLFLMRLRGLAMKHNGYISGETLKKLDDPNECLVISTWQSPDAWRQWVLDTERLRIQSEIDSLLGEKTEYEIYNYS